MTDRFVCSAASCERDEAVTATASQVKAWLMIEVHGHGESTPLGRRAPLDPTFRRVGERISHGEVSGPYAFGRRSEFRSLRTSGVRGSGTSGKKRTVTYGRGPFRSQRSNT